MHALVVAALPSLWLLLALSGFGLLLHRDSGGHLHLDRLVRERLSPAAQVDVLLDLAVVEL